MTDERSDGGTIRLMDLQLCRAVGRRDNQKDRLAVVSGGRTEGQSDRQTYSCVGRFDGATIRQTDLQLCRAVGRRNNQADGLTVVSGGSTEGHSDRRTYSCVGRSDGGIIRQTDLQLCRAVGRGTFRQTDLQLCRAVVRGDNQTDGLTVVSCPRTGQWICPASPGVSSSARLQQTPCEVHH